MKIIILFWLLILTISCKSQVKKQEVITTKKDTVENFNIEKYKTLTKDPEILGSGNYILSNGDKIQIGSGQDYFTELLKRYNSPYETYKEFHKNKLLKIKKEFFYSCSYGIAKEYNDKGKLIKEVNQDLPYKFSIEDLTKKMKEEYKIDIMNPHNISNLRRIVDSKILNIPLYEIWAWKDNLKFNMNCYLIDGNTGKTLFTIARFQDDKKGSLLQNYLDFLKK